jgi:hypothetical protein
MPSCSTVRLSIAYFAAHLPYGCRRAQQEPLRCFASYGRVSQHLPGGADMYSQHRRCQVAQPCVSPSPISRGGDCLHARHLLITRKVLLRDDATLPTPAPMFLVLRTRFATSACITMSTNPVRRNRLATLTSAFIFAASFMLLVL